MADGSSLPHAGSLTFDLSSQSGITELLLAVRKSEIPNDEKSDLRDLILLYTNGGRDESVRIALEQKITALGIIPLPKAKPAAKEPVIERPVIGTFRSAPQFSAPPAIPISSPVVEKTAPKIVVEETFVPVNPPPVPQPTPEPTVATVVPEPIPVVVKVPSASGQEQYLDRIREIKALVNQKVGNPVNLVDIDNAVGRAYMSALLDAMKRINSGASADEAMRRLEAAVVAVFAVVEKHAAVKQESVVGHNPEPPIPVISPEVPQYVPEPTVTEYVPEPVVSRSVPVSVPVRTYVPEPTPTQEVIPPQQTPVVPVPSYTPPQPITPVSQTVYPQKFSSLADVLVAPGGAAPASIAPTVPSVATAPSSSDPLFAADVEDGLTQLLSEWSIFKKSGIFGTGPKGREHPLYKKMAELQIPLLLAGRFEGATQEVRQSLTDYMNGWRYEQGIIYERGETFEHYLRRVIRHILDLQKG